MKKKAEHTDVYQLVTDAIIAQMEKGIIPWHQPWIGTGSAVSYATGKPYSMLNQMLLCGRSGEYLTFKQIQELGGKVKKGTKSSIVVFFKVYRMTDYVRNPETNEMDEKVTILPILRHYRVFHIEDCEGIKSKLDSKPVVTLQPVDKAEEVITTYVNRSKVKFSACDSEKAYYRPSTDSVVVPKMEQYSVVEEYYSTAFHELVHSTGHATRLHRDTFKTWGDSDYAKEELVAELGSAFLCNICGLDSQKAFKNSVAYLQNWLSVLRNDKRFIVSASTKAEKAVNYILGIHKQEEEQPSEE